MLTQSALSVNAPHITEIQTRSRNETD